jgi:hypothetical protein
LVVSAQASYQGWLQVFRPELIVGCIQKGDKYTFRLHLHSGVLGTGRDFERLRVKFDDAEAEEMEWYANDLDSTTYFVKVDNYPETLVAFLKAKTVLIEFTPFNTGRRVVAHFDLRGLGSAFAKSPECKLPASSEQ